MAATKYTYSISGDFPNQKVNTTSLTIEINESSIITALDHINTSGDVCDVWFVDALSGAEETELDAVVAAHQGTPPHVIGIVLQKWGNSYIASTTTTRYLDPGFIKALASTSPVQYRITGVLKNFYIRHGTPDGNGNDVAYTIRKNGEATALSVTLASTDSDGSDLEHTVIFNNDLVDIEVTKASGIETSPVDIIAIAELSN